MDDWNHLRQHWLFRDVPLTELVPVAAAGQEVRLLPGEHLFKEGDAPNGLYLIAAGALRVSTTNPQGEFLMAVVEAGDILGEMGVLDGQPRSGTATAVSFCVVDFLPMEPFLDLLERSPVVCMRLLVLLSKRLRQTTGPCGDLAGSTIVAPASAEP